MSEELPTDAETEADPETDAERDLLDGTSLGLRHVFGAIGLLGLGLLPFAFDLLQTLGLMASGEGTLMALKLTGALYFAVFAMSWDAVSGYTGQISFGHALFFAVGGYTSALLNLHWGFDPLLTVLAGTAMAAVAGVVVGVPALRLEGPYLSLVTLVAPLILLQIFVVFSDIFGGELGLSSPENLLVFESFETAITANYYLAFGLFVGVLALLLAVTRSDAGSVFTAIREDEDAVAAAGLNPAKFKIFAFVLSAAVGGLAGAMFVHTPVGNPQPSQLLVLTVSIEVIIAAVLGGMGTIVGPAIGGLFFYMFRDYLGGVTATVPVLGAPISELDLLLFSLATLVLLFVLPGGIVRGALGLGRWTLRRGGRDAPRTVPDGGRPGDATEPSRERESDGGTSPLERTLASYREAFEDATGATRNDAEQSTDLTEDDHEH